MREQAALGAVFIAVAAIGCGGGSGSGVSLNAFPQQYAQALCTQNFTCCSDVGDRTLADCVETNRSALEFFAQTIADAKAKGRVSYDPDQMQICIDAITALSCEAWSKGFSLSSQPDVCNAAVVAKVEAGGGCLDDIECTSHSCEGEDAPAQSDGTCAADSPLGKACADSSGCSLGFYCDLGSDTCAPLKRAGEHCNNALECETSCDITTETCSCYAGCAIAGDGDPSPASWLLICAAAIALAFARRSSRQRRSASPMAVNRSPNW